jgi:predicted P-loop ATPase
MPRTSPVSAAVEIMTDAPVVDTARRLGLEVRERPGVASDGEVGPCPSCGSRVRNGGKRRDKRLAIGLTHNGRGWCCHAKSRTGEPCGETGQALDLIAWQHAGARWRDLTPLQKSDVASRVHDLFGSRPVRAARTVAPERVRYPASQDVTAVWSDALVVDVDPSVIDALAARGIDAMEVARLGLAKLLAGDAELPAWARVGRRSWAHSGHRLLLELVDADGEVRSVLARSLDAAARPKSVAPTGHQRAGLALANAPARALLAGDRVAAGTVVVIAEGEVDHLSWCLAHDMPVISIVSGSWTDAWAARLIASGTSIVIATDLDDAGDKYARQIIDSLCAAVDAGRVSRWPHEQDRTRGLADANAYVMDGRTLHARGEPVAPAEAPKAVGASQPRAVGESRGTIEVPTSRSQEASDRAKRQPRSRPRESVDDSWIDLLTRHSSGSIKPSAHNLLLMIANSPAWQGVLAYDERREVTVVATTPPWTSECAAPQSEPLPRAFSDVDAVRVATAIERAFGVSFALDVVNRVIDTLAQERRFDPVRVWMDSLAWDGTPRLDRWLTTYLGVRASPLADAVGARWVISAVARTYRPGEQVDHTLVLVGPQAAGKSSALRALAGDNWFADQLAPLASKDAAIGLVGPLIIELAELEALKRADLALIKSFLTRRVDTYRPPYGRRNVTVPRRLVFAASTNEGEFLRDPTGARRFWPVAVGEAGPIDVAAIARDRGQLFAEAIVRFRAGEVWWIAEPHLLAQANAASEARRQVDPWESAIEDHIARQQPGRLTVSGVLEEVLDIPPARQDQVAANRVASILRDRLRWTQSQRRIGGRRIRVYVPPIAPVTAVTAVTPPTTQRAATSVQAVAPGGSSGSGRTP